MLKRLTWSLNRRQSSRFFSITSLTEESKFHKEADETLEHLQMTLDSLEQILDDAEVNLSQGVLTAKVGTHGTWVINKQTPNRQIWWSSPISGPRRYEFDLSREKWLNTRDESELEALLQSEIERLTGIELKF